MFFSYFILFLFLSEKLEAITKIEDLYPLKKNEQIDDIAKQFNQSPEWDKGALALPATEADETKAEDVANKDYPNRQGSVRRGHAYFTHDMHAYRIDTRGVHPQTIHHVFFIRHGLYFYTEDEPSSHLLRYGKYQARMAGYKINRLIKEVIQAVGPLTRPIRLVSSTQTRAYETLYNIRLQLDNDLQFEKEVILDTGVTECTDSDRQRYRWLYFVREYLQPIKSDRPEHSITIVSTHGNLLTSFDHIIRGFVNRFHNLETLAGFDLPQSTAVLHAHVLLYRSVGSRPINLLNMYSMKEIPITINHAELQREIYYHWAAVHQCRSAYARENRDHMIRAAVTERVFPMPGLFESRVVNPMAIVFNEMLEEFESHILPMMMRTCRAYLFRLPFIQANTDFLNFNRDMSPVPLPASDKEQRSTFSRPPYRFSAYGMNFPVENDIQFLRDDRPMVRQRIEDPRINDDSHVYLFMVRHGLNVETGDDRTSYLSRVGVNQIRGTTTVMLDILHRYRRRAYQGFFLHPVTFAHEPSIHAAESCAHIRQYLSNIQLNVTEQITDLGLQYNYFHKRSPEEFENFTRIQIRYVLDRYLILDREHSNGPSVKIVVLCGDGRFFRALRDELLQRNYFNDPIPRMMPEDAPGQIPLKHGSFYLIESIGANNIHLHQTYSIISSRDLRDELKIPTDMGLSFTSREMKHWFRSPHGPCAMQFYNENRHALITRIGHTTTAYSTNLIRLLNHEWNPYLAGMFIYTCRLQLTMLRGLSPCETMNKGNQTMSMACADVQPKPGPGGDCA